MDAENNTLFNHISDDPIISVLPICFSNSLTPHVHLHQYPLLTRPLQVPPSAAASGKRIKARLKPGVKRLEVHVPVDTRKEVWNAERSKELGSARAVDDRERNQDSAGEKGKGKGKERERERERDGGDEHRLSEIRMRSEPVPHTGAYVLGIVRDGKLHLHPISETHQFRPTLTYVDVLSRKSKRPRGGGSDDDSDDGPPPDPDDPTPALPTQKKEKKPVKEAKEVQVSVRKTVDDKGMPMGGGMTAVRREMLMMLRAEEDEQWEDYKFFDSETLESHTAFDNVFSKTEEGLQCNSDITSFLKDIRGL